MVVREQAGAADMTATCSNHRRLMWLIERRRRRAVLDMGFQTAAGILGLEEARELWKTLNWDQKMAYAKAGAPW